MREDDLHIESAGEGDSNVRAATRHDPSNEPERAGKPVGRVLSLGPSAGVVNRELSNTPEPFTAPRPTRRDR
jgi:hypothetical protein